MDQKATTKINVDNTPEGWAHLSIELIGNRALTVTTRILGALDDHQLFSLRYFFVELDRLEYQRRLPASVSLCIETESLSDAYRIQHYLAVMTVFRGVTLDILCGKTHLTGLHNLSYDFYRIIPLFCVTKKPLLWTISYDEAIAPGDTKHTQELVRASFQSDPSADTLFKRQFIHRLLDQFVEDNLRHLQQEMSGSAEENMSELDKQTVRQELKERLELEMPTLSMFARLLWSLFLRSLSDSKDLFHRNKDRKWCVNQETLRCTRLDAVSYAEGILQLIENVCIHSEMKCSYISIRLHDIDITGSGVKRVATAAQARVDIYEHYQQFWRGKPGQSKNGEAQDTISEYEMERHAKSCLEFSVLNDSTGSSGEPLGISKMFAENRGKDPAGITLDQVFSYQCETIRDISKHYGLRLLRKTVLLNRGFFSVCSPGTCGGQERYGSFYNSSVKTIYYKYPAMKDPCTDFDVLLPIYPHWHDQSELEDLSTPSGELFKHESLTRERHQQTILCFQAYALASGVPDGTSLFQPAEYLSEPMTATGVGLNSLTWANMDWIQIKDTLVNKIWAQLRDITEAHPEEDLYLLDLIQVWDILSLELLAKALFLLIAWRKSAKKDGLHLALLLPNEMFISEFIRIFSIFYDKQLSSARWMGNTQIALCGYQHDVYHLPQVLFLLAGESSGSARVTARTFSYYNTGIALDLVPQIRYLTRRENAACVPQFPFDLFLNATPRSQGESQQNTWFLRDMHLALDSDLWQRPHGCRIQGIRVRLHSSIYLSTFYEAELLFHNVGIIYRFAYLIAGDMLRQFHDKPLSTPLVVVGYEFYSSVLIEQIAKLLKDQGDVYYLIYSAEQEGERLHLSPQLKAMDVEAREDILRRAEYVAVLPIGTTMSTLYQIMREIDAKWGDRFPYENYVLILVSETEPGESSKRYWRQDKPGHVSLEPQWNRASVPRCQYYLQPQAQWSQGPFDENVKENEQVLVYVDQTSTRPREIFVVNDSHFKGISFFLRSSTESTENTRRLELLKGLVHYGHISDGNNHFQFYLDIERYFFRAQQEDPDGKRKTVDMWLRSLRGKIDPNAYNIIVSPLHQEDSPFAKAVIDQVFEHSLRFLHMDVASSFREDVRAKYSYIADEYQKIRQFDRNKPVDVYFVNTAITSGSTLTRARNLVMMLMEESGVEYDRVNIFKGCFVLVNRSAFDTINSYVKNPEEHFFAYLHLAVPSFNSSRDRCPTCELLERYRTLEYSSAENLLGHEFRRLRIKLAKRTKAEYRAWMEETVMSNGGYAAWLRQWMYSYVRSCRKKDGKLMVGIFEVEENTYKDLAAFYKLLQWGVNKHLEQLGIMEPKPSQNMNHEAYLDALHTFTLNQLANMIATNREDAEKVVGEDHSHCLKPEYWQRVLIDYVCAQKNYIRLVSTHQAFLKMDIEKEQLNGNITARGNTTATILAELMQTGVKKADTRPLQAEWFISYLKVFSRPHLAQYHHIRQGILTLMLKMVNYAIGVSETLPDSLSFAEPLLRDPNNTTGELIRYQVLQTLLKRLAGLQSSYSLQRENMSRIWDAFTNLRENFFSHKGSPRTTYWHFNPIPTQEREELNIVKLVKWASSCGDDENGCHLIENSFLGKDGV